MSDHARMFRWAEILILTFAFLAALQLVACSPATTTTPAGLAKAATTPVQATSPPPLSSTTASRSVQIEADPPQAEPGQPVTIRVEGLDPAIVAGKAGACVALMDEAGKVGDGPSLLRQGGPGTLITRITLSDRLTPGIYRWTVSVCGTGPETPADIQIGSLVATIPYTITARTSKFDRIQRIPSPDGQWIALLNKTAGSLDLQGLDGKTFTVFSLGSTAAEAIWSPDSRCLLVVRTNFLPSQPGEALRSNGPIEIWQVRLEEVERPTRLFQSKPQLDKPGTYAPEQIALGQWSPNNRHVLFWLGPLSASAQADGLMLWVLDTKTGKAALLASSALLNPRYQSWAPDGSALVFTAGGYRSAQINKWLNLFDVGSGRVTTVVSETEQIPGIVAWSPRADLIAYAAVPAAETGKELADWMSFDNRAIAGRRIYLLNPATGHHRRLNDTHAFQDAPTWSYDGAVLYYVQREGNAMTLMAADPTTGQAQVVEGSRQPAPQAVGYYGQSKWDDLLAYRPEAYKTPVPPVADAYTDPTYGYTLRYPAGWCVGQGWQSLYGWQAMPTISPCPPDVPPSDLGPFSGRALIAVQVVEVPEGNLEALLRKVLESPGPGQILEGRVLMAFDRRDLTIDNRPAIRLETMGGFGTVNHVLMVGDGTRGLVVRGRGDGRVFDAVAGSLRLR